MYAYDPSDEGKLRIARALLSRGWDGMCVLSTQVLAEFASTMLHKKKPAAHPDEVKSILDALAPLGVKELQMPASPQRVWLAIHAARRTDAPV